MDRLIARIPPHALAVVQERTRLPTARRLQMTATNVNLGILHWLDKLVSSANPERTRMKHERISVSFAQRVHFLQRTVRLLKPNVSSARLEHFLQWREALNARRALLVRTVTRPEQLRVHSARLALNSLSLEALLRTLVKTVRSVRCPPPRGRQAVHCAQQAHTPLSREQAFVLTAQKVHITPSRAQYRVTLVFFATWAVSPTLQAAPRVLFVWKVRMPTSSA